MLKLGCALTFVLALSCPFMASAQQSPASTTKPDYSKQAYVYEQVTTKSSYEEDGTGSRDSAVRIRIQSEAGVQHWGVLRFSYENSVDTMDILYVRVRKPDGTVVATPAESVQDMTSDVAREAPFYSDLREKHIAVKGLSAGDTLEYACTSRLQKPLAAGQFWGAQNFTRDGIVLAETFELSVPGDRPLKLKSAKIAPGIADRGKYRIYTWNWSNPKLEEKNEEELAIEKARGRFDAPDIVYSSFQSWDEVGRWYAGLQADRIKPTPDIQAKAAELTKGLTSDDAKLRAIYKYVATEFRYVGIAFGIGRYQPHSATEVLANQYGDCKDKHTLLASLLAAAGTKIYPALINTSRDVDADVPSPGQFDHVVGAVPQGDAYLWLDTTAEVAPAGYLLTVLRDKHALLISDSHPAVLVITPPDPPFAQTQEVKITGKLSDTDVLDAHFERTEKGDSEVLFRAIFRRTPETQWKDIAQAVSYASGFGGTVSDASIGSLSDIESPFRLSYSYNRKDYGGDWENHRITPPVPLLLLPRLKNDDDKPKESLWLGSPRTIRSESRIELPAAFRPELPRNVDLKRDFADYRSNYSFEGNTLIARLELVNKMHEVPVAQYGNYESFLKAIDNDRDQYIQLSTRTSSSAENALNKLMTEIWQLPDSKDPNALKYENEAQEAFQSADPLRAIEALKNAVVSDPKFVRDWLLLGRTYEGIRKLDKAEEAFRGATVADPTTPLAWKLLGFCLMSQHKYDDAVKTWQTFISADPQDADGPANLGSVLDTLKRYKEAAAAYESAIKLGRDTPNLETNLGIANLSAGDTDAATIAFSKALELDTTPDSKNTIAYEYAEAGLKLPLALDYAKQAVNTVEEESRKVDIAILKTDDLRPTRSLGPYWDTLGWVYYKMDDLSEAERYLLPAWNLSQDSVVADHLGQVYEKQHKSAAALRMYRLAVALNPKFEEASRRLARLQGTAADHSQAPSAELSTMRTIKLPLFTTATGSSEVFVLASRQKIEDVLFVSGSEKFKPTKAMFSATSFQPQLPLGSSAFVLRRGILSCFSYTGCSLVVYPVGDVRSVN
jgi:tetratricopeptide (TPR) repeat protein